MPAVDPKGFLTSVLHNGMGRYVCQLQRLTLRFCKEFAGSRAMRDFIEKDLLDFARHNPGIVVYVQPARHQRPLLRAEFLNGRREDLSCEGFSREMIIKYVDHMRCRSGVEIVQLYKDQLTETLSIQGPWTPFTSQPTEWNVTKYPDQEGLRALKAHKSATDIVLEMAREQGILNVVSGESTGPNGDSPSFRERSDDQTVRPVVAGGLQ